MIFLIFTMLLVISCSKSKSSSRGGEVKNDDPTLEKATSTETETKSTNTGTSPQENNNNEGGTTPNQPPLDLSSLNFYFDNFLENDQVPTIRVEGLVEGDTLELKEGSCSGQVLSSLNQDGTFTGMDPKTQYSDTELFVSLSRQGNSECTSLNKRWIHLENPTISLNATQTNTDKRYPKFDITNLFVGKQVQVTLYDNDSCSGESLTEPVSTDTGSVTIGLSQVLTDIDTHSYYAKQSYLGLSSCSGGIEYSYNIDVDNLSLTYDEILYGLTPSGVTVTKMLEGSSVSLYKGSCESEVDDSIDTDGTLTPIVTGNYTEEDLYLKYSFNESSDCKQIGSKYLYLEQPVLGFNTDLLLLNRQPKLKVSNLLADREVAVSIYSNSSCTGESLSDQLVTNTGSVKVGLKNLLQLPGTYSYYAKQTYLGFSTCSQVFNFEYQAIKYMSTLQKYNRSKSHAVNNNRGIVLTNTIFNNTLKIYEGSSCTEEENLLTTLKSKHDHTEIELPTLPEGTYRFSIKEIDPEDNVMGCFTTDEIDYKYEKYFYRKDGENISLEIINEQRTKVKTESGLIGNSQKPISAVYTTVQAMAILFDDGSVKTYGNVAYGGDSSSVAEELDGSNPVVSIRTLPKAFVAIRADGSAVTWGDSSYGGDSSSVASELNGDVDVTDIFTGGIIDENGLFAALRSDGSLVTWGNQERGGNSSSVSSSLDGTIRVVSVSTSRKGAMAALRENGSVITWGDASRGGNSSSVSSQINGTIPVVEVYGVDSAFAALRDDGSVITWGSSSYGGNSSLVADKLNGTIPVVKIYPSGGAFAALRLDGSVVFWGGSDSTIYNLNHINQVFNNLNGQVPVVDISTTDQAFAALKVDGSIYTFGNSGWGGNSSGVSTKINGTIKVKSIIPSSSAFSVIREDGSVVSWGSSSYGGDNSSVASHLDGTVPVTDIYPLNQGFIAVRSDNKFFKWGSYSGLIDNGIDGVSAVYRNSQAVAIVSDNGRVTPKGNTNRGGVFDAATSAKLDGTNPVINISSTERSFTALRADGSLVSWGNSANGANNSSVASKINGTVPVRKVCATSSAYAAVREDDLVVTWGNSSGGGNSSSVASELDGTIPITNIYSTISAFAALRGNGSVITWGSSDTGGDSSLVASELDGTNKVTEIFSHTLYGSGAFAALREDGSVITWGTDSSGGDSSSVSSQIDGSTPVTTIYSTGTAFAALREDGSVISWGDPSNGGNSSGVGSALDGTTPVVSIFSNTYAFAALRENGSVVSWGHTSYGGKSSSVASKINGDIKVTDIYHTDQAFAALRENGSVVSWGNSAKGGDSSSVASKLDGTTRVVSIVSNLHAFAALRENGSVVTWGDSAKGGDSSSVEDQLDGSTRVVSIYSSDTAFIALRDDGTVVVWGDVGSVATSFPYDFAELEVSDINNGIPVIKVFPMISGFVIVREDNSVQLIGNS